MQSDHMQNEAKTQPPSALKVTLWVIAGTIVAGLLVIGLLILGPVVAYHVALKYVGSEYEDAVGDLENQPDAIFLPALDYDVPLADKDRERRLRASIAIGFALDDQATMDSTRTRQTQIENIIKLILMGKTAEGITTTRGRLELREEIRASLNHVIGRDAIKALRIKIVEIR